MKLTITHLTPTRRPDVTDDDILKLAESIRTIGLINPVTIDENDDVIAGRNRILAAQSLGWKEIDARRFSELDDWEKAVMEVEENLRRVNYSDAQKLLEQKRLHDLYVQKHGKKESLGGTTSKSYNKWKVEDTAQLLGISTGAASQDIKLATEIEKDPTLAKLGSKAAIRHEIERREERKTRTILAALLHPSPAAVVRRSPDLEGVIRPTYEEDLISIYHEDCLKVVETLPDSSVACLVTDPPWEVEFDQRFMGEVGDAFVIVKPLLMALRPKLQLGALCWMFCATRHLITGRVRDLAVTCGYHVFDQILIWYKPATVRSSNPYSELKNDYEPALLFARGTPRKFNRPIFAVQQALIQSRRVHPAQKPVEVLKTIIDISTAEGELVFDPFCGSGQSLIAAREIGRRAIGCESNKDWYAVAVTEVNK